MIASAQQNRSTLLISVPLCDFPKRSRDRVSEFGHVERSFCAARVSADRNQDFQHHLGEGVSEVVGKLVVSIFLVWLIVGHHVLRPARL